LWEAGPVLPLAFILELNSRTIREAMQRLSPQLEARKTQARDTRRRVARVGGELIRREQVDDSLGTIQPWRTGVAHQIMFQRTIGTVWELGIESGGSGWYSCRDADPG